MIPHRNGASTPSRLRLYCGCGSISFGVPRRVSPDHDLPSGRTANTAAAVLAHDESSPEGAPPSSPYI